MLYGTSGHRWSICLDQDLRQVGCVLLCNSAASVYSHLANLAVTLAGSILFILFGFIYLYEAFHTIDIDVSDMAYHP